jgi:putative oxidoreductase
LDCIRYGWSSFEQNNLFLVLLKKSKKLKVMKTIIKKDKDLAALILRIGFGFFIAFGHGLGKLQMLLSGNIQFPALFGISPTVNLVLATLAEFVAGIMVLIGFKTRLATIPLMITMATAVFIVHLSDPLFAGSGGASKEFAFLYLLGFAAIFFLGSGKYSVDAIGGRRR